MYIEEIIEKNLAAGLVEGEINLLKKLLKTYSVFCELLVVFCSLNNTDKEICTVDDVYLSEEDFEKYEPRYQGRISLDFFEDPNGIYYMSSMNVSALLNETRVMNPFTMVYFTEEESEHLKNLILFKLAQKLKDSWPYPAYRQSPNEKELRVMHG